MYFFTLITLCGLVSFSFGAVEESVHEAPPEIRCLVPPKLEPQFTGQKFMAYRPCRKGGPRLEIESRADFTVVHNYGHGGSGWTMAPGCAKKMVKALLDDAKTQAGEVFDEVLFKETPVSVLGAGVVGTTMAYELWVAGFKDISVIAEQTKGIVSDVSGGLIAPIVWGQEDALDDVSLETYRIYSSILNGDHPHFTKGIRQISAYFRTAESSGFAPYIKAGLMAPSKPVTLRFPGADQAMVAYDDALFVNVNVLMTEWQGFLKEQGILFKNQSVMSLSDIGAPIVVNAAGLGALKLTDVKDEALIPVQGHLIMMRGQPKESLNYMVFDDLGVTKTKTGYPYRQIIYWLPKYVDGPGEESNGVLGGSFIEDSACVEERIAEIVPQIYDQGRAFFGIRED